MSTTTKVLSKFGPEDKAQRQVIVYCETNAIIAWHVPNSTYTGIMQQIKNKLLGVRPGVPDLFLIVNRQLIAIEMKSLTGSATPAQREMIRLLNDAGIPAIVAKGADMAIMFIEAVQAGDDLGPWLEPKQKRSVDLNPPPKTIPLKNSDIF